MLWLTTVDLGLGVGGETMKKKSDVPLETLEKSWLRTWAKAFYLKRFGCKKENCSLT